MLPQSTSKYVEFCVHFPDENNKQCPLNCALFIMIGIKLRTLNINIITYNVTLKSINIFDNPIIKDIII